MQQARTAHVASMLTTAAWPLQGRCLCGAVTVSLRAPAGELVYCHCGQCRKTAGSAFIAVLPAHPADVIVTDPQAWARAYRASPAKARWFCGRCGTPLWSARDSVAQLRVRAGLFDSLAGVGHAGHIHASARAPWDTLTDELPYYAALEPGRAAAATDPREEPP